MISVGDATQDVFVGLEDANVLCDIDKNACVLTLRYADKIPVQSVHKLTGGNAANNAIGSARLGMQTALSTITGDDSIARDIRAEFDVEQVASDFIATDVGKESNYSVILNFRAERTILIYHLPRTYVFPDIGAPTWLYLTSMGEGFEPMHEGVVKLAAAGATKIGFNPGTHQLKVGLEGLRPVLAVTDVLFLNKEEAQLLANGNAPSEIPDLLRLLKKEVRGMVVITDGMAGAYAFDGMELFFQEAYPLEAVERTGAGDAFSTAFIAALFYGHPMAEALTWGAYNGASVSQQIGPHAGLLTRAQMEEVLAANPGFVAEKIA